MRDYTLTKINEMVEDAWVQIGTELYPFSDDEQDDDEDDDEYEEDDEYYDADEKDDPEAIAGVITHWNEDRGYGFVEPAEYVAHASAGTYFVHVSQLEDNDENYNGGDYYDWSDGIPPEVGDWVYFYEDYDHQKNRWHATNVVNANLQKDGY
jgi:cold shock CspA family protein